jgi:hypothetical protein
MLNLLNELNDEFQSVGELRITNDTWFEGVKRAAIVKAFEFCVEVYRDSEATNSFFLAPALRGICEDLIAVTFIQGLPEKERNRVAVVKAKLASVEASEKQKRFFGKERPWQPVVTYPEADKLRLQYREELKLIGENTGLWPKNKISPNVSEMAQKVDLSEVYDFV